MSKGERPIFGVERLGALSDGVIAIALTLLVLELKIPEVVADEGVLAHIVEQLPHFVGWAISFVFISVVWHEQHLVFAHLRASDSGFILVTLAQLACVSLIPFASALLGDFATRPGAVIAFSAVMLLNSAAMAANAAYLARNVHLHARAEAAAFTYRALFHIAAGSIAALVAIATAYLHHPLVGAIVWLITPVLVVAYHVGGHPRFTARAAGPDAATHGVAQTTVRR
jgi:uncharacterized membrane protein